MRRSVTTLALALAAAALLPIATPGEVVRLRDGSMLRGRLMNAEGDSLTFRLSIGASVKIPRSAVLAIVFDDSLAALAVVPSHPVADSPVAETGTGKVSVSFKDRRVSSKISIDKKVAWDEHVRSNYIVTEFFVDGKLLYSAIDSTMDKTIYKGQIKELKNDAELEDFTVEAPAGTHQCELVVRNQDPDTFRDDFEPQPLSTALVLDSFEIRAGGAVRIDVGIDKGAVRLGRPKLYRVE